MKDQPPASRSAFHHPDPDLVCRRCGQPGAFAFDEPLCAECCHARGSCGAVRESESSETSPEPSFANTPEGAARTRIAQTIIPAEQPSAHAVHPIDLGT